MWSVLESQERRALKSLSDLAGTDVYVHHGTPEGVFRELGNALVRLRSQPAVADMRFIFGRIKAAVPRIISRAAARSIFEARVFKDLIVTASALANERLR